MNLNIARLIFSPATEDFLLLLFILFFLFISHFETFNTTGYLLLNVIFNDDLSFLFGRLFSLHHDRTNNGANKSLLVVWCLRIKLSINLSNMCIGNICHDQPIELTWMQITIFRILTTAHKKHASHNFDVHEELNA